MLEDLRSFYENDKNKKISLRVFCTSLFGLSFFSFSKICHFFGLNLNILLGQIQKPLFERILSFIHSNFMLGSTLKKEININKKFYIKIRHLKGICYLNKLPVNGQRTKTNHKTIKKISTFF